MYYASKIRDALERECVLSGNRNASEIFLRRGDMCFRRFALVKYRPAIGDEMRFQMLASICVIRYAICVNNYTDANWIRGSFLCTSSLRTNYNRVARESVRFREILLASPCRLILTMRRLSESIPSVITKGRFVQVPKMQHDTVNSSSGLSAGGRRC